MSTNAGKLIFVAAALIAALICGLAIRASTIILAFFIAMLLPGAGLLCALSGSDESSDHDYLGLEWDFKNNRWII